MIALTVLAFVMLGIYSVLERAITITSYSRDRHYVMNKGYERILRHIHYPRIALRESELDNNTTTNFVYNRKPTIIPGVKEVELRVNTDKARISYEYFERSN